MHWLDGNRQLRGDEYLGKVKELQDLLRDVLMELPLSSVQVEKQHACLQRDSGYHKLVPRRPHTVQASSYIMTVAKEFQSIKSNLEKECFGSRRKVSRMLLKREVESARPTSLSLRKEVERKTSSCKGMVKQCLWLGQNLKNILFPFPMVLFPGILIEIVQCKAVVVSSRTFLAHRY